jgi:hypothetical protein
MVQAHKAQKQPQDPYAQQGKMLASSVQRLRGWVGSDPSRAPDLADALIELTAHRLLGHGYAAAAEDAQDSVRRAAELLAAQGPIGPYTSVSDAARYVTAVVHMATIQSGLGMPDAAGRTIDSVKEVQEELGEALVRQLQPQTVIWALSCSSRAALESGDIAAANAYADAALSRLVESGLGNSPDTQYLAMDVDRLASDCRWAAGRVEDAVAFLHAALTRHQEVVDGRLDQPARLSPARLDRLAEPLFSLYRDMADRLVAYGEVDLGLTTRRRLIELLRGLSERLGDPVRAQLALALADLARDLTLLDRLGEADALRAEAAVIMPPESADVQDRDVMSKLGTEMITWYPLPSTASYAATTASSADTKIVDLTALQQAWRQRSAAWLEAERPQAKRLELERMEQARAGAERREAERVQAERAEAEQRAAERARAEEAQRLDAERRTAAEEAERQERKRRRQERIEAHRLEVERREAERREAERLRAEQRAAEELAADPAEAERLELERLQAEIDELERAERMARGEDPPPRAG